MTKKAHHSNNHRSRKVVTGAMSALGLLAVSTQAVNAEQLTVKAGDTIWGIAKEHGLSVSALEKANPSVKKISDSVDLITAGQQLTLPSLQDDTSADLNADGSYTVKPGDTLSSIADRYNVSVAQLMAWNGLSSSESLYIGQQLSVSGPAAEMADTPVQQPVQSAPAVEQTPAVSAAPQVTQQQTGLQESAGSAASQAAPIYSDGAVQSSAVANSTVANVSAATDAASTASATVAVSATATSQSEAATSAAVSTVAVASASTANDQSTTVATTNQTSAATVTSAVATQTLATGQQDGRANYNPAALYGQSFVATTPASSQAPQTSAVAQSNVATSTVAQSSVAPQASTAASQQTSSATQAQQQSQAPAAAQPAQQQASGSQDLQHGSVVSLATKIANSNSVPYVWGGETLNGMDCSGLVKYVYANAEDKQLPHYTGSLEKCVNQHSVSEAQPGDLLFWGNHGSTYHTAIYTGNNQYVAAAKPGTNVASYTISPYFQPSFAGTVK